MPKFTLTFCLLLLATLIQAQPELTAYNTNPIAEETVKLTTSAYADQGSPGENITWDFSSLTAQNQVLASWVLPSATSAPSAFPSATIAYWQNSNYDFYNTSPSEMAKVGVVKSVGNVNINYFDNETIFKYPLKYNDSYSDSFKATYNNVGVTIQRKGQVSVHADGYGTVILPTDTIENALRIKITEFYTEEFNVGIGGNQVVRYTTESYAWYVPGIHAPVIRTIKTTSDKGGQLAAYTEFQHDKAVSIATETKPELSVNIYPNPVKDKLNIDFNLDKTTVIRVALEDLSGKKLMQYEKTCMSGKNKESIDLGNMPAGIYILKLQTDKNQLFRKLSKI